MPDSNADPKTAILKQAVISVRAISKRFGGVAALSAVTLDVREGELLSICGENGAGKSTLMKILCGQHTEYDGQVLLRGQPVRFSGIKDAESHGISIIHQELNLVEELSVAANIFLGRELSQWGFLKSAEMNHRARGILSRLDCDISPKTIAGQLRVGDQQLIEIARALSMGSDIMIMDEPTSALTETESARLDRVIDQLRKSGVTILYISHKMDEIFRLSDRIAILRDGRLVNVMDKSETSPREVAHNMVGREFSLDQRTASLARIESMPALEVSGLWRRWPNHPRKWRLNDISFSVQPGEIVGFAGLMGAGRTELFECLFGVSEDEHGGMVKLNGRCIHFTHPREALDAGIAMVTEDRKRLGLFGNLDVGQNISLNSLHKDVVARSIVSAVAERKRVTGTIDQLQIRTDGTNAAIGSLSGGNQQKCVIGRSLLTDPKVLLLDDPTRGVDIGAKSEIYRLMRELADRGIAILMTSSELPELLLVCDRIIVLNEGRIAASLDADEATEQLIMEAATK